MADITVAELDQLQSASEAAQAAANADPLNTELCQAAHDAAQAFHDRRAAWKQQELNAGRRHQQGFVGGDAFPSEGA